MGPRALLHVLSLGGLVAAQDLFLASQPSPTPTHTHNLSFALHRQTSETHALGYTVQKSTFLSPAMSLRSGEMVFTVNTPLTMPTGRYAILNFSGEIVDKDERSVPLDVVYNHHWVARPLKVKPHKNVLCKGGVHYVFGIGAESRLRPNALPSGYGYISEDGEQWGANIHLLHTEDLTGPAKECIECWYGPNKGPKCTLDKNGTFDCCGDRCAIGECNCPTTPSDVPRPKSDYFLKYEVYWTSDLSLITPVETSVLAAPNCKAEYSVLRNNEEPEQVASYSWTSPVDSVVVLAQGHIHSGALNVSMYKNGEFVCASMPRYGAQPLVAGDELGHLVDNSPCLDGATGPMALAKGDEIRVDGWYYVGDDDQRLLPGDGGSHLGVMAYMQLWWPTTAVDPDLAKCQEQLVNDGCQSSTVKQCYSCGRDHTDDLTAAGCTTEMVKSLCDGAVQ